MVKHIHMSQYNNQKTVILHRIVCPVTANSSHEHSGRSPYESIIEEIILLLIVNTVISNKAFIILASAQTVDLFSKFVLMTTKLKKYPQK